MSTPPTPGPGQVAADPRAPYRPLAEAVPGHPPITDDRLRRLRTANVVMGLLHAAQTVAVLALANDFTIPVTAAYQAGPPGSGRFTEPVTVWDEPFALGVAAFLAVSALAHLVIAGPAFRAYARGLRHGHNSFRWVEYSVSASIMIVLIAQLTGITDLAALSGVFAVNACMILFGWLQERYEFPGSGRWLPFVFGSMAGAVPWLLVLGYALGPGADRPEGPPAFVWAIIASLFVFFNTFGVNQALQYARVGPWRDYLVGEWVYVLLSLTAKSALAWQVFGGTLAG
ncbi:MAG: heliorhodopsin HeR [Kineosporiaceae bacterium]